MANPQRGEFSITVTDERSKYHGREFILKISVNAGVKLQQKFKKPLGEVLTACAQHDFEAMRGLVWLMLQKNHAADFKTEDQAGDFLDDVGLEQFGILMQGLVATTAPDQGGRDEVNPLTAQGGTGDNSTSTPGALPH